MHPSGSRQNAAKTLTFVDIQELENGFVRKLATSRSMGSSFTHHFPCLLPSNSTDPRSVETTPLSGNGADGRDHRQVLGPVAFGSREVAKEEHLKRYGGVLSHGGTPDHHPFLDWD